MGTFLFFYAYFLVIKKIQFTRTAYFYFYVLIFDL